MNIIELLPKEALRGRRFMPQIVADSPDLSCFDLNFEDRIEESQLLGRDPFQARARSVGAAAENPGTLARSWLFAIRAHALI
jgi:hypothetical protein